MRPDEARWRQMWPDDARWGQIAPDDARWRQMRPDEARWGQMSPDDARWSQMRPARWGQTKPDPARWGQMMTPDEARWPPVASSGVIWFGGVKFHKNEKTILHFISLCETFDLESFWNLGWPGTLLWVCGWSLRTDLRQYVAIKVTSISEVPRTLCINLMNLSWCGCHVVVALLLKLPRTLCGDLRISPVLKLLHKNYLIMTLPDRVYEFCCCAVGALLLYCCCVVVEASPHAMRWSDDIYFIEIPWQETLEHDVPWPCSWVLLLRCCCVVVALLLRCCRAFPHAIRWSEEFSGTKLK